MGIFCFMGDLKRRKLFNFKEFQVFNLSQFIFPLLKPFVWAQGDTNLSFRQNDVRVTRNLTKRTTIGKIPPLWSE